MSKADATAAMLKIAEKQLAEAKAQTESWRRTRADYLEMAEKAVAEWEAIKAIRNKNANQRREEQEKHKDADRAFKNAMVADTLAQDYAERVEYLETRVRQIKEREGKE